MKFYVLIILCLVQGLTEFLPISSSGHLLIIEKLFKINDNILLLNLFLHLATLISVLFVYRKSILKLIKKPIQPLTLKLIISTLITVVFAFIYEIYDFGKILDSYFGYYFLVTSLILFITYQFQKNSVTIKINDVTYKNSLIVGVVQGFAILPGISRSGSTISCLTLLGNDNTTSAEYSFLLSIPVIIGGFIFELIKVDDWGIIFNQIEIWQIVFSFIFTIIVSVLSLKLTINLLKKNKFIYFSIYLLLIGISVILFL